jgi:hypothetical protein
MGVNIRRVGSGELAIKLGYAARMNCSAENLKSEMYLVHVAPHTSCIEFIHLYGGQYVSLVPIENVATFDLQGICMRYECGI